MIYAWIQSLPIKPVFKILDTYTSSDLFVRKIEAQYAIEAVLKGNRLFNKRKFLVINSTFTVNPDFIGFIEPVSDIFLKRYFDTLDMEKFGYKKIK